VPAPDALKRPASTLYAPSPEPPVELSSMYRQMFVSPTPVIDGLNVSADPKFAAPG
jgi:hypothetical protein